MATAAVRWAEMAPLGACREAAVVALEAVAMPVARAVVGVMAWAAVAVGELQPGTAGASVEPMAEEMACTARRSGGDSSCTWIQIRTYDLRDDSSGHKNARERTVRPRVCGDSRHRAER